MRWTVVPSPIGELLLAADAHGVCAVEFDRPGGHRPGPGTRVAAADEPLLAAAAAQLGDYFAGAATGFTVPLSITRGSAFERAVWAQLALIPYGETRTYGQIAAAVTAERPAAYAGDRPDGGAARAVGTACHRNPLPVVVPCHRVIGAGRTLVGFGGGLTRKRFLLELEAGVQLRRALSG